MFRIIMAVLVYALMMSISFADPIVTQSTSTSTVTTTTKGETQVKSLEKFFQNKTNIKVVEKLSEVLSVKDREVKSKGKLKNVSFMFTGKLQNISRAEAKSLIEENAGSIVSSVTKKLDYLVTGEKPTNRKIEQAKNLGIKILTQKEWSDLLN